jgi:hypothetical protein
MAETLLTTEQVGQLGESIYAERIKPLVEPQLTENSWLSTSKVGSTKSEIESSQR